MTFKQESEENKSLKNMSKELYDGFIDLIQFEIDKLSLISAAKSYFYMNGMINYKKFLKDIYKGCEKIKCCLIDQLRLNQQDIPEFIIPEVKSNFENKEEPFKVLSNMEDEFEKKLIKLINIAFDDKDWKNFHYLLKKLDTIDHICCRALAAVKNNANILELCEQHTTEK